MGIIRRKIETSQVLRGRFKYYRLVASFPWVTSPKQKAPSQDTFYFTY